jgi:flotillin
VKIDAQARAEAEAIRIRTVAEATAESIRQVNAAIREGGESYLRYRQVELLPNIAPALAAALAQAKMVTIAGGGGGGAAESAIGNISSVIQTVLAAQLVTRGGLLGETNDGQKG